MEEGACGSMCFEDEECDDSDDGKRYAQQKVNSVAEEETFLILRPKGS